MVKMISCWVAIALAAGLFAKDEKYPIGAKVRGYENIEWSEGYSYHLTDDMKNLPRVLLVGDSICRGYVPFVVRKLKGEVNISYWVSSYCVTRVGYLKMLEFYLDESKYDVIHFNNGLHSLGTPVAAYENGLAMAFALIREKQPKAKLVWCSSTPLTNAVKTAKCRELNAAAAKVVARFGGIATDDLFSFLDPLDREANWCDECHHNVQLCGKDGEHVASAIRAALSSCERE